MNTCVDHLDVVVKSYIETMLWSESDDNDCQLQDYYSLSDVAPETLEEIKVICKKFLESIEGMEFDTTISNVSKYEMLGHDLWLTSRGSGTGFWDAGRWTNDVEARLCELCYAAHGQENLKGWGNPPYVGDDGKIYILF